MGLVVLDSLTAIFAEACQSPTSENARSSTGGKPQLVVQLGHSSNVYSIEFSSDGKYILTVDRDETARLWEVESGKELRQFRGIKGRGRSNLFSLSPKGRYVIDDPINKSLYENPKSG
jgi:WD40 repeat protein